MTVVGPEVADTEDSAGSETHEIGIGKAGTYLGVDLGSELAEQLARIALHLSHGFRRPLPRAVYSQGYNDEINPGRRNRPCSDGASKIEWLEWGFQVPANKRICR